VADGYLGADGTGVRAGTSAAAAREDGGVTPDPREQLGRLVRQTWVACAEEAGDTKPSHLAGWDDLDEDMREVDMRIGEAVAALVLPGGDEHLGEPEAAVRASERERERIAAWLEREGARLEEGDFDPSWNAPVVASYRAAAAAIRSSMLEAS
jgi:hypothetical protein